MTLINTSLIKNPLNWITVMLMVLIAGFVIHQIVKWEQSI